MSSKTLGNERERILKEISLRPSTPADQPFLVSLYATTRSELDLLDWNQEQKDMFVMMQFNAQSQQYNWSYPQAENSIVMRDQEAIGRIIINEDGDEFTLVDISLIPAYRGLGIGSHLLRTLLTKAGDAAKPIRLHVLQSSPAKNLYERLGFSIVGGDSLYCEMFWHPTAGQ